MILSLIVAAANHGVIGENNQLLWKLPDDMRWFKEKTMGHVVIMGRKTYDSIPAAQRPLPGRMNVVISRTMDKTNNDVKGAWVSDDLSHAIKMAMKMGPGKEVFVIGGGQIYKQALPLADRVYLTQVHGTFEGDTFFPKLSPQEWRETSRESHPADSRHGYTFDFVIYERR